jgi:hypothetical protein
MPLRSRALDSRRASSKATTSGRSWSSSHRRLIFPHNAPETPKWTYRTPMTGPGTG